MITSSGSSGSEDEKRESPVNVKKLKSENAIADGKLESLKISTGSLNHLNQGVEYSSSQFSQIAMDQSINLL